MKVGDTVICIRTHSQWVVKKGQVFTITSISSCGCGVLEVTVGISSTLGFGKCMDCGHRRPTKSEWRFASDLFRKVEPQTKSLSKELAEQLKDNPEWVEIQEEVLS